MKNIKVFENKIPLIFTVVCCVVAAALSAAVRMNTAPEENITGVSGKGHGGKVIVLDAGHPTYLNTQTPRIWLNQAV